MTDDTNQPGTFRRLATWATTPPQAYGVYLGALVLVFLLSFYAGSLKPKTTPGGVSPPVSTPRN